MQELCQNLYEDLVYRGHFTPYQAVEESRITFHVQQRTFKFYIAPRFQNEWRTNTALLLLQVEFRRALKRIVAGVSTGGFQRKYLTSITLEFSKWPKFAPILTDGRIVETYEGPEDIVFGVKQQKLYPAPSRKYTRPLKPQHDSFDEDMLDEDTPDSEI